MSSSEHDEPDVMSGRGVDMTTGAGYNESEPGRSSPSSAVCYAGSHDGAEKEQGTLVDVEVDPAVQQKRTPEPSALSVHLDDESDSTPRSEVPSALDSSTAWEQNSFGQPGQSMSSDTGYFAPQPLRYYANRLPSATPSTEPSPTPSLNASTTSVNRVHIETTTNAAVDAELQERPSVLRDLSSTSTATTATMRVPSTEPAQRFTTPPKPHKDVPTYPNQAYAALQLQHYPPPYSPQILRTRSSHATHFSVSPSSKIAAFSLANDLDRSVLDTGSRTVGNSPASSPGLFSPTTPPSQHPPDEQGFYSSPYLHYTHRQAPKETHVADVDVDPISGRKIINSYEVIDELGRGVHGKVKLGRNLDTGVYVAIKIVDRYSKRRRLGKNTNHEDKIKKEIAILKKARHPNIVSLLEVIDDPSRKKVYIVLEHVELGEVKWRMEAAKEIAEVEWRRFQRESQGIFDNDAATHEDDSIITTAHRRLEKRERQRLKELHDRRMKLEPQFQTWSFEHGGDSDEETSDNDVRSRMSEDGSVELPSGHDNVNEGGIEQHGQGNTLHTASRSQTPIATSQHVTQHVDVTGLEGTMYGAYEPEIPRGRTPSLAGSLSSHFTDLDDLSDIPEHFRYVPLMTLEGTRDAFRDTVLGLEYLHYQGVIHRDIKPANLLLTKEHKVKISDFGVSFLGKQSPDESDDMSESETHDADEAIELAKTVGTPAFYAPELCRTDLDTETPPVTGKIDVWALGVTLYCLVFGRVPFHDHNTFVLMRLITDTEVYIPRCRLKAVAEKSSSRPSSRGPKYQSISSNRRAPHDLEYEPVNDDLYDLLKRLLLKDPRKRITLKEIKHHPWLLQGIENKVAWVEETDPTRQTQGRKIEVSKDEVAQAVMPIKFMDRVQSVFKKVTGAVVGLGNRGASRRRAQSSVTNPDPGQLSTASSSSTISQDGRRPSLAINESIYAALRSSREPEHPLSHSVTVSPEAKDHPHYFDGSRSRPESPMDQSETSEHPGPLTTPSRPHLSDRAQSTMSTTASIRTIRQSDILNTARAASPPALPALPGTPTALDSPGGSNLGGIFGGLPRRVITSVRSRDRNSAQRTNHNRTQSIDRLVDADDDAHGGPTLALSNTLAAGHVDPPSILKDHSPVYPPMTQIDRLFPDPIERTSSRQSSISSTSSRLNHVYTIEERTASQSPGSYPFPSLQRNTSDDRFNRAKDELMRRRILEDNQRRDRPLSGTYSRPVSALSEIACPPSPDDEVYFERQRLDDLFNRQHPGQGSSIENSPVGYHGSVNTLQSAGLTSSSSEDHFTSMSQSTSNPSIPSVISATSSVALDDAFTVDFAAKRGAQSIESSLDPSVAIAEDYAGYDGDHAVESGDDQADSDDSDEEDFIIMTKKSGSKRSESIANGVLARSTERALSSRRRSTRSGSNGTVKKIRPLEETDDDQHRQQSPETTSKTL